MSDFWGSLQDDGTDFFSIANSDSRDYENYSEVFRNQNHEMKQLITIDKFEDKIDTLSLKYNYEYNLQGFKKRIELVGRVEEDKIRHQINYNNIGNAESEYSIIELDTHQMKKYYYNNNEISKIEDIRGNSIGIKTVKFYGLNERIDSTISYKLDSGIQSIESKTVYFYVNSDEYIGYKSINYLNKETIRVKVNKLACD